MIAMPPEQIALIKADLITLLPDHRALSARFYARLFARRPELCRMFGADVSSQEGKFVDMLAMLLNSMAQTPGPVPLARLGQQHHGYGVEAADYDVVGQALLEALAETFGPAWTPEQQTAWAAAYAKVAMAMQAGLARVPAGAR